MLIAAMLHLQLRSCVQLWSLHSEKDFDKLERVHRKADRMGMGLKSFPWENEPKGLGIFNPEKKTRHVMIAAFKCLKGVQWLEHQPWN